MIPFKSHKSTNNKPGTSMVNALSAKAQKQPQKSKIHVEPTS